ncbi:MAG: hypothetical protein KDD33_05130 [Bdellovibrionales bacterium]|nr:hypothetical protein [Bdellovibrionales bacterium]
MIIIKTLIVGLILPISVQAKTLTVDVEKGTSLAVRSKTDMTKIINSLSLNEPVLIVDPTPKTHEGTEYILVRRTLFPELRCVDITEDDSIPDPDHYVKVMDDEAFLKYKVDNSIKKCPIINAMDYEKNKRYPHRVIGVHPSSETPSVLEGYVAKSFLKGFHIPKEWGEAEEALLKAQGYRVAEPFDFEYYKEGDGKLEGNKIPFFSYFNKGQYFLSEYSDGFLKTKRVEFNKDHDAKKSYNYTPVYKVKDGFVLHLVQEKGSKVRSVYAHLSGDQKLKILKKFEFRPYSDFVDDHFYLIPKNQPVVVDQALMGLNQPLPFYGLDPWYGAVGEFDKHDLDGFMKYRKIDPKTVDVTKAYENYQKSIDRNFAIVIFSHFAFGDRGINPGARDSTMQYSEIIVKNVGSQDVVSSGETKIF